MVPARRVKVLLVVGTLEYAGTPMHVYELVRRLDRSRFEPEVCCLAPASGLAAKIRDLGIPLHEVPLPIVYHPGFAVGLARLARLVRRRRFDVVHTFLFTADVFGSAAARLGGAPKIVNSRRMEATWDAPRRVRAYRWSARWVDRILTPSGAARRACLEAEGHPAEKVLTIHNGIDLERIRRAPEPAALPEGPGPWIGAVGHLKRIKGHRTLVEAMPGILRSHPSAGLLIAGDGPERTDLEARCRRLGIRGSVHLLGARQDVPGILRRLDLFVLPSDSEGLSNALLEAMAASRGIVATRTGGNPEVVEDGRHALLVPPGDSAAMAASCVRLLDDAALRAEMGDRAHRRVVERFTVERMAEETGRLYESLAGRAGAVPETAVAIGEA